MGDPWRFCVDAAPAKLEHMTSWGGGGRRGSTGTGAPQVRQRGATGAGGGGRGGFTGAGVRQRELHWWPARSCAWMNNGASPGNVAVLACAW